MAGPPFQPELPFTGDPRGLESWRAERAATVRALEERFGILLSRPVRLQLRGLPKPFVGTLEWVVGTERAPRFRLRGERLEFGLDEIESCERLT